MIKTNQKLLLTTFIGIMLFANLVLAQLTPPHQFYGTVTWNGSPAPDGTTVVAKINGIEVASTTTKDGKYGYDPIFYVDDPNSDRSGEEIRFFVNGVDTGQTSIFCNGCSTGLNLTASGGGGEGEGGSGGGGGGGFGGGGGGGFVPPTGTTEETTEEAAPCQERWICSDWSECVEGQQTRTCEDANNCGTDLNKPFESQPCTTIEGEEEEVTPSGETPLLPTGFFLGLSATDWLTGVIAGVMVAAVIIFILTRKRITRKRKKKK